MIAAHITNRYLYLAPVVRGIAKDTGLGMTRIFVPYDEVHDLLRNDWAMLTNDEAFLKAVPPEVPEKHREAGTERR